MVVVWAWDMGQGSVLAVGLLGRVSLDSLHLELGVLRWDSLVDWVLNPSQPPWKVCVLNSGSDLQMPMRETVDRVPVISSLGQRQAAEPPRLALGTVKTPLSSSLPLELGVLNSTADLQ